MALGGDDPFNLLLVLGRLWDLSKIQDDMLILFPWDDMDVSENSGTPKSSNLIGFSIINHPFGGTTIYGNTHIYRLKIENEQQPLSVRTIYILPF